MSTIVLEIVIIPMHWIQRIEFTSVCAPPFYRLCSTSESRKCHDQSHKIAPN